MVKALPSNEILAANIQSEMDARGWNQSELAAKCGLPQPRISEILSGEYDHRLGTVDKIAKAFGIPSSALLVDRR